MDRQSLLGFRSLERDLVPHENMLSVVAFQFGMRSMRRQMDRTGMMTGIWER